jgi:putative transposase
MQEGVVKQKPYATDLTDTQWQIIEVFLPPVKTIGRPRTTALREVVHGIRYVLRSGCAWRLLTHEFPPWQTVYRYFRQWTLEGVWEAIHTHLREALR